MLFPDARVARDRKSGSNCRGSRGRLEIPGQAFGLPGMTIAMRSIRDAGEGEGGGKFLSPMRADRDLRDASPCVRMNHMRRRGRDAEMFRREMIAKAKQENVAFTKIA